MPSRKLPIGHGRGEGDADGTELWLAPGGNVEGLELGLELWLATVETEGVELGVELWLALAGTAETEEVTEAAADADTDTETEGEADTEAEADADTETDAVADGEGDTAMQDDAPVCPPVKVPLAQARHATFRPPEEKKSAGQGAHTPFCTPRPAAQSGKQSAALADKLPTVEVPAAQSCAAVLPPTQNSPLLHAVQVPEAAPKPGLHQVTQTVWLSAGFVSTGQSAAGPRPPVQTLFTGHATQTELFAYWPGGQLRTHSASPGELTSPAGQLMQRDGA
jgi:hypothetical protein